MAYRDSGSGTKEIMQFKEGGSVRTVLLYALDKGKVSCYTFIKQCLMIEYT